MILGKEHTWFENGVWTIDADFCCENEPIVYDGAVIGYYNIAPHEWWEQPSTSWKDEKGLVPVRHYALPSGDTIRVEFFSYRG
jgi:hypothetical protein